MGQTCVKDATHWGEILPKRLSHADLADLYKNETVQKYLQQLVEEHRDTSMKLQHVYLSESDRKILMKKHAELRHVANVFERSEQAKKDLEEVLSLLQSEGLKVFVFLSNVMYT